VKETVPAKSRSRRAILAYAVVAAPVLTVAYVAYTQWTNAPVAHVDVHDGFDTPRLSGLWETSRFERGAVTLQSEIVRAGRGAAKIVLHSRDRFEAGVNGNPDTERAELLEAERLVSREDRIYEYAFSMFMPADFPTTPVRLVLAQWKQDCLGHPPCSDDGPVIALRYASGTLALTLQTGGKRSMLYETDKSLRGKWSDFRFRIRFTPGDSGLVQAWIDGAPVADYRGATAYPETAATGYVRPSRFYFKMGLYRNVTAEPMTIYIDEYSKRELDATAAPSR
jgi:polysaccharide lyase-like protein